MRDPRLEECLYNCATRYPQYFPPTPPFSSDYDKCAEECYRRFAPSGIPNWMKWAAVGLGVWYVMKGRKDE